MIPVLHFALLALIAYKSGKELKEDIEKHKLTKKWL